MKEKTITVSYQGSIDMELDNKIKSAFNKIGYECGDSGWFSGNDERDLEFEIKKEEIKKRISK